MDPKTQTIAISKETVNSMPVVEYPGGISTITVVDTPAMAKVALRELTRAKIVGFDTETRPSFTRGRLHKVALMQLSTADHCYLFRLNKLGISEGLRKFLEDPEIIKVGLSVHDDFSVMRRLVSDLDPQGFIDLQEYVKYFHINDISLQKVYAIVFQEKISKNQRLTNWEAPTLTEQQQIYAAIDAWACLRLYRTLRSGEYNPDESPYIVDRSQLCPSSNNQLLSPAELAAHEEKLRLAAEKQEKMRLSALAAEEEGGKPKKSEKKKSPRRLKKTGRKAANIKGDKATKPSKKAKAGSFPKAAKGPKASKQTKAANPSKQSKKIKKNPKPTKAPKE